MAYSSSKLKYWDQWLLHSALGQYLLNIEDKQLASLLKNHLGEHTLLVGVPSQISLLNSINLPFQAVLSSLSHVNNHDLRYIEAELDDLPILTGSIDLAIIPHTLDFLDNPRQLLSEICRIIKPEGLVAISGFNPYSLWGLKRISSKHKKEVPWSGNFLPASQIKKILKLADFHIESTTYHLYFPPLMRAENIKRDWLEYFGSLCFPFFGGIYIVLARAKVAPLTPIRLKWKQQISGIRISPTVSR